jgi:hypothetical protein
MDDPYPGLPCQWQNCKFQIAFQAKKPEGDTICHKPQHIFSVNPSHYCPVILTFFGLYACIVSTTSL